MKLLTIPAICYFLLTEVVSQEFPRVVFMNQILANNSYVNISAVGNTNDNSVQCQTDLGTCCSSSQGIHRGDWYFPDGDRLTFSDEILEIRGPQVVELRRVTNVNSPTGMYRCDIPTVAVHDDTDISVHDTIFIGLYTESEGNLNISEEATLTVLSDLNGFDPKFTLTCTSTGGPATTVTWTRDSVNITEGSFESVLNDTETAQYTHTLTLTGRLPGLYSCTVSNNKPSSVSQNIQLEAGSPPTNLTATRPNATSIEVSWYPPSPLGDTNGYIIFYATLSSESSNGSIFISNNASSSYRIDGLLAGVDYVVSVVGTSQHFPSDAVSVLVIEPPSEPKILSFASTKTTITISWRVPNDTTVTDYTVIWERDTTGCSYVDEGTVSITSSSLTENVTISGLEEGSRYFVRVTATNKAGNSSSETINITTKEDIPSGAPSSISLVDVAADSFTIQWDPVECIHRNGEITGYSITYREPEGIEIMINVSSTSPDPRGILALTDLLPSVTYSGGIAAVNRVGVAELYRNFAVLTHVAVPVLSVENTTSVSIYLQWTSAGREHVTYNIIIERDSAFGCPNKYNQTISIMNGTITELIISGLEEASRYKVNITAFNDVGSSEVGNTVMAMTSEAAPSTPPVSVNVTQINPYQIRVEWTAIECTNQNGMIMGYIVCIEDTETTVETCNTTVPRIFDSSVAPRIPYSVKVAAVNNAGAGPFSVGVMIMTEEEVPGMPVDIEVLVEQRQLQITWSAPSTPSPVSGYNLSCTPTSNLLSQTFIFDETHYTVEGLAPGTEYNCSLVAFNVAGAGAPVSISFSTLRDYVSLRLEMSGIFICSEWVKYFMAEKAQAVSSLIVVEVASSCSCSFSEQHITNATLLCPSGSPQSNVLFDAALDGTASKQSSDLLDILNNWVSESPTINVLGVTMGIGENCSAVVSEITQSGLCSAKKPCPSQTQSPTVITETNGERSCNTDTSSSSNLGPSIGVGAGVAIAIIALTIGCILLLIVIVRCRQNHMRKYEIQRDIMNTRSNMAYGMTVRKSKETALTMHSSPTNTDPNNEYDVVSNTNRAEDTPPTEPRNYELPVRRQTNTGEEYEISTPVNIRKMRSQKQSGKEDDDKDLYLQIPSSS